MKKIVSSALTMTMLLATVAGCSGQGGVVASPAPTATPSPSTAPQVSTAPQESAAPSGTRLKTGLYLNTDMSLSKNATAGRDGVALSDILMVAVAVDDSGVIHDIVIDGIRSQIGFSNQGKLTTDMATEFASKNELGYNYGMNKVSSISKEWNEQAAFMAQYALGKTVEELKGIAVNEKGVATDADLASSVTLHMGRFVGAIEAAVNNAAHLGAQAGDRLALTSTANMAQSKDAAAGANGLAQAYTYVAAVTMSGDTVTSCYIDAVKAKVDFDATGAIVSDVRVPLPSKNEIGDNYGMKAASSISKEWYEQAAAFSEYVTGKTVSEVSGIAVDENGVTTDADLVAGVTIGIGKFQNLIQKAAQ